MKNKILITGAGGFIGSHLAELCAAKGYDVKAFLHYNSRNHWGWLETSTIKKEIEIVTGDIRDYDSVFQALKGCNTAFHLAALIGIPYSYISPIAYIKTNVEGTYNVLESARRLGTESVIITSTSENYGTAQYVPIDEQHPLVAQSPYSASKIAADQLALSYHRSFSLPVRIARPFNTFGPRQSARAVIPTIILQILSKQNPISLGNVHPTRDFTFVKDTVAGFIEIANSPGLLGEVTNIGTNSEVSVGDLLEIIGRLMNTEVAIAVGSERIRAKKSEVDRLCCDNTKIRNQTKWKPEYNLEKGLVETVEWIRENSSYYKSDIYNV